MKSIAVLLAAMCLGLILNDAASAAETADLVISGGTIYSGGDDAPFVGDVAVTGDKIVYIGPHAGAPTAKTSIDAQGMIVAPGFIDVHTHPEDFIRSPDAAKRLNAPWLMQGVSTTFIGVDGWGSPRWPPIRHSLKRRRLVPTSSAM